MALPLSSLVPNDILLESALAFIWNHTALDFLVSLFDKTLHIIKNLSLKFDLALSWFLQERSIFFCNGYEMKNLTM